MASWPGSLPLKPEYGVGIEIADQLVRSSVDVGEAKVRRRYSQEIETYPWEVKLTAAQSTTLRTFVYDTLGGGADWFDGLSHPLAGHAVRAQFVIPPRPIHRQLGPDLWAWSFVLNIKPST